MANDTLHMSNVGSETVAVVKSGLAVDEPGNEDASHPKQTANGTHDAKLPNGDSQESTDKLEARLNNSEDKTVDTPTSKDSQESKQNKKIINPDKTKARHFYLVRVPKPFANADLAKEIALLDAKCEGMRQNVKVTNEAIRFKKMKKQNARGNAKREHLLQEDYLDFILIC